MNAKPRQLREPALALFDAGLGQAHPVISPLQFRLQQISVVAAVHRQAFESEGVIAGLDAAKLGCRAGCITSLSQKCGKSVYERVIDLGKGERIAERCDWFAEVLFDFRFGI